MQFEEELARVLPQDLPHRERLISLGEKHLDMISAANEYMNLTRIVSPEEAAIKHIYDCVAPWRFFQSAARVLDVGTGAGFPGIPLAIVLPEVRFTLAESIGKKARFVESVVDALELPNATVIAERGGICSGNAKSGSYYGQSGGSHRSHRRSFRETVEGGSPANAFQGPGCRSRNGRGEDGARHGDRALPLRSAGRLRLAHVSGTEPQRR